MVHARCTSAAPLQPAEVHDVETVCVLERQVVLQASTREESAGALLAPHGIHSSSISKRGRWLNWARKLDNSYCGRDT